MIDDALKFEENKCYLAVIRRGPWTAMAEAVIIIITVYECEVRMLENSYRLARDD